MKIVPAKEYWPHPELTMMFKIYLDGKLKDKNINEICVTLADFAYKHIGKETNNDETAARLLGRKSAAKRNLPTSYFKAMSKKRWGKDVTH